MQEPYLSQFVALLGQGAGARDIHDSTRRGGYDSERGTAVAPKFLQRELDRVEQHRRGLCAMLAPHVPPGGSVLDVGCGTGGTAVALATSGLRPAGVVGVDVSDITLQAARVRARAYGLAENRILFRSVVPGARLPFADAAFDLVTCVSVLEFISSDRARERFIRELLALVRPGGHLFVATPSPFRLREYHSRRWIGDARRTPGFPWSSTPWSPALRALRDGNADVPLARERLERHPLLRRVAWSAPLSRFLLPWQQYLVCRPAHAGPTSGVDARPT